MRKADSMSLTLNENMIIPEVTCDSGIAVREIYLDGKLNKAESTDDSEKSFGIFMHSLILSNSDYFMRNSEETHNLGGDEIERAISHFTVSKGFDNGLIESIAPKIADLTFDREKDMRVSTHLINGKLRFITRGTPEELLKRCTYVLMESKPVKITRRIFREINDIIKGMINRGLTVFALGIKDSSNLPESMNLDIIANNLAFVALVGIEKDNYNITNLG